MIVAEKEKIRALDILNKNKINNLSIIGFINENTIENILIKGNSVYTEADNWIYLSSESETEFTELLKNINIKAKHFAAIDDWMIPLLTNRYEIEWLVEAYQFHFPEEVQIPENKIETTKLTQSDLEIIVPHVVYQDQITKEYLSERIENSVSAGIYKNGKLVAWALTHDDGSLGTMHVLEEYRRKGYAREITISLLNQCRKINKIPFLQTERKNTAAQNLVKSIGFVKDKNLNWMKLK